MDSRKTNGLPILAIMFTGLIPGGRPSKFLYSGKNKKIDPWGTSDNDHGHGIELSLQPRNKIQKTKDIRSSPGNKLNKVVVL